MTVITRPLATLLRGALDDGVDAEELARALELPVADVRQTRFWRPTEKFTPAEKAEYRDRIRFLAWKLPYWERNAEGRMQLLPAGHRRVIRGELDAQYRERLARAEIPAEVQNLLDK